MTRNKIFGYLINQSYKNLMFVVVAMAMIFAFCADYAIADITPNLLYNPNADLGLDGWVVTPPGSFIIEYGDPQNNLYPYFSAVGDDESSAYQDVNVSQHAGAIDNGGTTVNFNADFRPLNDCILKGWCYALLRIYCMNENLQELGKTEKSLWYTYAWWEPAEISMPAPVGTRYIRAEMYTVDLIGVINFDNLSLTLAFPELKMITSEVNFGNLYVNSNGSTWDYNKSREQTFQFMNSGPHGSKLNWSISSSPEVSLNPTSGSLDAGGVPQTVDVSLQPSDIENTTIESDYTLLGDAWLRDDGAIRLTQNYGNLNGQAEYSNLPLGDKWNVSGEFWTGWGGDNGGDAFYVYVWADRTPLWQEDNAGHYSINFYEYYDRIELRYDGVLLASVPTPYLDALRWYSFRVTFHEGTFTIWCDGSIRLTYTDNDYQSRMSGNLFGFGGRTGAATNEHWVRYMKWSKHIHAIHLETACGNIDIPIVANAYHLSQPIYVGPKEKGPNGKVNVASNTRVPFEVNEASTSNPDVTDIEYQWQKVVSGGDLGEFEPSTVSEYNFTFDNPGDWTVYCKYVEKVKRKNTTI